MTITLTRGAISFDFDNTIPGGLVQELFGWGGGAIDTPVVNRPFGSAKSFPTKSGQRVFGFNGKIIGSSLSNWMSQRRQLLAVLLPTDYIDEDELLLEATTDDGLDIRALVRLSKQPDMDLQPDYYLHGFYSIELVAEDPLLYLQTETTVTIAANGSGTANNIALASGGANVRPVFTITGPGTDFTITNTTTGEFLVVEATLTAGQSITIDVNAGTIQRNDGTNLYGSFTDGSSGLGDWIKIVPGDNGFDFDVASGNTGATELDIVYRKAYKGI